MTDRRRTQGHIPQERQLATRVLFLNRLADQLDRPTIQLLFRLGLQSIRRCLGRRFQFVQRNQDVVDPQCLQIVVSRLAQPSDQHFVFVQLFVVVLLIYLQGLGQFSLVKTSHQQPVTSLLGDLALDRRVE